MSLSLKWKNAKAMARVAMFSLWNGRKYGTDSILYPYINTATLVKIMLDGQRSISSFELIRKLCSSDGGKSLVFGDICIPIPDNENQILHGLLIEIGDIILPYLFQDDFRIINGTTVEGPYEIPGKTELKPGDVVIDAGANLGLFSAVAATKGCHVYAFEPIKPIVDKYLSLTARWNPSKDASIQGGSINIVNKALSDSNCKVEFLYDDDMIGSSTMKKQGDTHGQSLLVESITLDEFAKKENLQRIDFIKADIEGSERNLLMGAKEIMREFAPKIAVRTYHLPDDSKVLKDIILCSNPCYTVFERYKTMYAYVKK